MYVSHNAIVLEWEISQVRDKLNASSLLILLNTLHAKYAAISTACLLISWLSSSSGFLLRIELVQNNKDVEVLLLSRFCQVWSNIVLVESAV